MVDGDFALVCILRMGNLVERGSGFYYSEDMAMECYSKWTTSVSADLYNNCLSAEKYALGICSILWSVEGVS